MSSRNDSGAGIGCFGFLMIMVLIGWVVEHWLQILLVVVAVGVVGGFIMWMVAGAEAADDLREERARCAVCGGWSGSVVLTDIDDTAAAVLCRDHGPIYRRIMALEAATAPPPDPKQRRKD